MGTFKEWYFQWFDIDNGNVTLGIHTQNWISTLDLENQTHVINQVCIGLFFFRIVIEFVL